MKAFLLPADFMQNSIRASLSKLFGKNQGKQRIV